MPGGGGLQGGGGGGLPVGGGGGLPGGGGGLPGGGIGMGIGRPGFVGNYVLPLGLQLRGDPNLRF